MKLAVLAPLNNAIDHRRLRGGKGALQCGRLELGHVDREAAVAGERKIKPPMVISPDDCAIFLDALDAALAEVSAAL